MLKTGGLELVQEWDKTFPKSDKVDHCKVTFATHFGITLAAHSYYMGRDTAARLRGDNKRFLTIPGATHTDLYDGGGKDAIPFDEVQAFFEEYLG